MHFSIMAVVNAFIVHGLCLISFHAGAVTLSHIA